MPSSVRHGKQEIKQFVQAQTDIRTIVDVGVGSGTYRYLLGKNYYWIGIEIFQPYILKFGLQDVYQQIIVGDISEVELPQADCIIFGDVLEHLPKSKALEVLRSALVKYKHVVVSIPIGHYPGQIHYGNENEAHISEWEIKDIQQLTAWKEEYFIKQIGIFCK